MSDESKKTVAVIGGGIGGLMSAMELQKQGYKVTIFEETVRHGGKIEGGALAGHEINLGAEFIDSDSRVMELAKQLNVKLVKAEDMQAENFQRSDGTLIKGEEFHKAIEPLKELMIRDQKKLADSKGQPTDKAIELDLQSMPEYLHSLNKELKASGKEGVSPEILKMVSGAFASEFGQDPKNVSALQMLKESSTEYDSLLKSDAGWRVAGGTHKLIEAMRQHLAENGAEFHTGTKLEALAKNDNNKFNLKLSGENTDNLNTEFDRVSLAVPAHALAKISGLEEVGMNSKTKQFLSELQTTHSSKIFIKTKDGADLPKINIFGDKWQAWDGQENVVTFLVGGKELNDMGQENLTKLLMTKYAAALGKKPNDIFELDGKSMPKEMVFGAPDTTRPCYPSPSVGQSTKASVINSTIEHMAKNGIAISGNFVPDKYGSVGFMENAVESAHNSAKLMKENESLIDRTINSIANLAISATKSTSNILPHKINNGNDRGGGIAM
ncbi:MAG: FAD-dependent oxidoreductase [Rickettsiales bacterium]